MGARSTCPAGGGTHRVAQGGPQGGAHARPLCRPAACGPVPGRGDSINQSIQIGCLVDRACLLVCCLQFLEEVVAISVGWAGRPGMLLVECLAFSTAVAWNLPHPSFGREGLQGGHSCSLFLPLPTLYARLAAPYLRLSLCSVCAVCRRSSPTSERRCWGWATEWCTAAPSANRCSWSEWYFCRAASTWSPCLHAARCTLLLSFFAASRLASPTCESSSESLPCLCASPALLPATPGLLPQHPASGDVSPLPSSPFASEAAKTAIQEASELAPLHNPPNLYCIEAAQQLFPDAPHVGVIQCCGRREEMVGWWHPL